MRSREALLGFEPLDGRARDGQRVGRSRAKGSEKTAAQTTAFGKTKTLAFRLNSVSNRCSHCSHEGY